MKFLEELYRLENGNPIIKENKYDVNAQEFDESICQTISYLWAIHLLENQ